ncbi:hypothetical protein PMAYCL1PPCAC_20637, partial [Pristionchus mayeri]
MPSQPGCSPSVCQPCRHFLRRHRKARSRYLCNSISVKQPEQIDEANEDKHRPVLFPASARHVYGQL